MANTSEQISELSAELLLKAVGELSQVAYQAASLVRDVGKDAGVIARSLLIKLINSVGDRNEFDRATQKALNKLEEAAMTNGSTPRQITVLSQDLEVMEKWLKKQDILYVAATSKKQEVDPGAEKSVIFFLEKDTEEVCMAASLVQYEKGFINELPPQAFLFVHEKKDIAVADGLDIYELEVFRQVAKQMGLIYSAMVNGVDEKTGEVYGDTPDSYKIICSKGDTNKLAAVLQQVSWSMTGEYKDDIKEKIKERYSIKKEIQDLIENGVKEGNQFLLNKDGTQTAIENAKYIVNAKTTSQYIKLTTKGFLHYKYGNDLGFVSKDDPEYTRKLEAVLGEFTDAVIFDAGEWEAGELNHSNRRKGKIKEKLSVFPFKHNMEKENEDLRKAHKKRLEDKDPLEETAWLFHKFDAEKAFSEVVEVNYNDHTRPLEETVSVHYNEAVQYSEKYRYFDVVNDEKSIDNIILAAREKSAGNDEIVIENEKEIS